MNEKEALAVIDSSIKGVMETVCANCFSNRETPIGCKCLDCETCSIETEIKKLAVNAELLGAKVFAFSLADSLKSNAEALQHDYL